MLDAVKKPTSTVVKALGKGRHRAAYSELEGAAQEPALGVVHGGSRSRDRGGRNKAGEGVTEMSKRRHVVDHVAGRHRLSLDEVIFVAVDEQHGPVQLGSSRGRKYQ